MRGLFDFNKCKAGFFTYRGSDEKRPIVIDGEYYFLKLADSLSENERKPLQGSYSMSPASEDISCRIIKTLDIPVQETLLGMYENRLAVACKDFIKNNPRYEQSGWELTEFATLENSIIESSKRGRTPYLNNILEVFNRHPMLEDIREKAIERYWDTFVIDSLIGNFDRHSGNWGYMSNYLTQAIELAPIYDCGSSLFPKLSDAAIPDVLNNDEAINQRIYQYPTAALIVDGKKVPYLDFMLSERNEDCTKAIGRIAPRIDPLTVNQIIDDTPGISDVRKDFLKIITGERYKRIIAHAYKMLMDKDLSIANTTEKCQAIKDVPPKERIVAALEKASASKENVEPEKHKQYAR